MWSVEEREHEGAGERKNEDTTSIVIVSTISDEMNSWWLSMPKPLPEYESVVSALIPELYNLPPKIIAIDGLNGTGKTTLARYLACKFNCTLLETDLFMNVGGLDYRYDHMAQIISRRICSENPEFGRPIIVEGVTILQILDCMNLKADFHIYWNNGHDSDRAYDRADRLGVILRRYCKKYNPQQKANLTITSNIDISPISL
jgi:hypothetical protein